MRELTAKIMLLAMVFGTLSVATPAFADSNEVTGLQNQVQSLNDKVADLERSLRSIEAKTGAPAAPYTSGTAENKGGLLHLSQDINMGGYVDVQWNNNFTQPNTGSERTPTAIRSNANGNRTRAYDRYDGSFSVNAAKLYLEKTAAEAGQAGFRVDLKFGEDANITNANSSENPDNLSDLEQAYVEYKAGAFDNSNVLPETIDIKAGRFFTLAGFETVDAPTNWNISRSLMFLYAAPFTHTGVRTHSAWFDGKVDTYLGFNNGWDRAIDNNSMKTLESGLGYKVFDDVTVMHAFYFGPEEAETEGSKRWVFTNNALWQATDKLALGADYEVGEQRGALNIASGGNGIDDPISNNNAWWWGIAGYAKYKFTDKFAVASRSEMFHDASKYRTQLNATTDLASAYFSQSLTAEYNLTDNLITRAEFRWDRANDADIYGVSGTNAGERSSQTTLGAQVIYLI